MASAAIAPSQPRTGAGSIAFRSHAGPEVFALLHFGYDGFTGSVGRRDVG